MFGGLFCLMVVPAVYRMTARSHFEGSLRQALWELRQSDGEPLVLPTEERLKLLRQLRSPIAPKRWDAAKILASWKDSASVPSLVAAMQDEKGTHRTCEIAHALGQIGHPAAVPALAQAIDHPRNLDLRVCATQALAEIGDEAALAPLLKKVAQPGQLRDDCAGAIVALGELGSMQALPALRTIAEQNADPRIRDLSESTIAQIELLGGEAVVPKLLAALDDNSDWIHDRWIFNQLGKRWDDQVRVALNDYLASRKEVRTDNLIQATALLIHHQDLMPATIEALAQSPQRQKQWLGYIASDITKSVSLTWVN